MKLPAKLHTGLCVSMLVLSISTLSAQVGIGTTTPNSNALLDVDATVTVGGLLLPRIGLTSTSSTAPLSAHVAGMLVYNTATSTDVTPGYYYNDGSTWVRVASGGASNEWSLSGNASTTPGTHYLGTSDDNALRFKTVDADAFEISAGNAANRGRLRAYQNGTATVPVFSWAGDPNTGIYHANPDVLLFSTAGSERFRILANGQLSLNNASPIAGDRFTVTAASTEYAINGYTSSSTGVYGENSSGAGNGVFGNSSNVGIRGYGAHGSIMEAGLDAGYGAIAWNTTSSGANRTGLLVLGQNLSPVSFANTGAILYGEGYGGTTFASSATGTGFAAVGNAGTTVYALTSGSGIAASGSVTGVYGISTATSGSRYGGYFTMNKAGAVSPAAADDPVAILAGYNGVDYFGGYFDGNQDNVNNGTGSNIGEDYAYIGVRSGLTTYKVIGTGSNSTLINDLNGNKRVLFSPEAPEILFEDYGTGKLANGTATIALDPLLSSVIHVSPEHPLKVFIQLEGDCNGVFVTNKSANGFTVKELRNGTSNVPFSWHIVANRADTVLADGTIFSKHVGVRFPIGPNKIIPQEINAEKLQPASRILSASETSEKIVKELQKN